MKRLLGLGLALGLFACGLTDISVDGEIGEQQVQGDPLGGLLGDVFQPIPVQIDVQSAIDAQDLSVIKAVFLDKIVLNITATANQNGDDNFNFVDKIDLFATAPSRADLPRVKVASLSQGDTGATTLTIEGIEGVDLKDYIEAGINIEAEVTGNAPSTDTSFDGTVTVTVEAI